MATAINDGRRARCGGASAANAKCNQRNVNGVLLVRAARSVNVGVVVQ